MRHLHRNAAPVPPCLALYRHGANNWDDVTPEHKAEIRACLEDMQGRWCAYCEGDLNKLGQHIEHFEPKGRRPQGTFLWSNLFWSCDQADSCGQFKENGAGPYEVHELVNPCTDDPDLYFRFRFDGTISTRQGLSDQACARAMMTLRVFNLDPEYGRLRQMRKIVLKGFDYVVDLAGEFSKEEIIELLADELEAAQDMPFQTAIRHVLTEPRT